MGILDVTRALFSPKESSNRATRRFLARCQRKPPLQVVRLTNATHTAVFAPTGVGKGVSIVIPHLLTCTDCMVVVDFKGELVRITADARRRMGHRVIVLDPFNEVGGRDTFNPLDGIYADDPNALDRCRALANMLTIRTGNEHETHWIDSAEGMISAMIALVVKYGEDDRSLQTIRPLLTDPAKLKSAIDILCGSKDWSGMLSRLGYQLTHAQGKELSSVLTTTNRMLRFLDTQAVAANTRTSSFKAADLRDGNLDVFLVLPADHIREQSSLLRMWIGSMMMAVVKGGPSERKVRFVIDEASSLGHCEFIDDAIDKYRGYGVRLLLMYQSLGHLKKCFPDGQDQTLLSNVTQVFFGVNDPATADYVSNRLGDFTQVVSSGGTSYGTSRSDANNGASHSYSSNSNSNWQQAARKLLQASEILNLNPRFAITFHPGAPPICTWLARYFERGWMPRQMGFFKAAFDSFCLATTVALLAAVATWALFNPTLR